jgi:hypothetical protein
MNHKRALNIAVFILFTITATHISVATPAATPENKPVTTPAVALASTPIIAGYITPVPDEVLDSLSTERPMPPIIGGIKMTYSGYNQYTNADGFFQFPKHHAANELRIVICSETDYNLLKNTVSKIEVTKKTKPTIAVYRITKDKDENGSFCKVESQGTSAPSGGLLSSDIIIHADPNCFYIQADSVHFDSSEPDDIANFIIPADTLYLLKTPTPSDLTKSDNLTESVDAKTESDIVASKSTETDSMGEALPGIHRLIMQTN